MDFKTAKLMTISSKVTGFKSVYQKYGLKTAVKGTVYTLSGRKVQDVLPTHIVDPLIERGDRRQDGPKEASYVDRHNAWLDKHFEALSSKERQLPFKSPKIALIADLNLDQCKKYRVLQKYEACLNSDIEIEFCHWLDQPRALNMMQLATHVIFYRIPDHEISEAYLNEARRLNLSIIYDLDDPIFNVDVYKTNTGLDFISRAEKLHLLKSSRDYARFMHKCDILISSTPDLKTLMENDFNKPVYLWRNLVDAETHSAAARALNVRQKTRNNKQDTFIIGYMSGSRSHEANFRTANHAIAKIMAEHDHVEMKVVGYLEIPKELEPFKSRITQRPYANYDIYIQELSEVDLNIIPLCIDPFNDCKSAIRYLEASLVGKPTIVAKTGDFMNIIEHGKTGYLINEDEWHSAIENVITNPEHATKIGRAALSSVTKQFLLDKVPDSAASIFTPNSKA